MRATLGEACQLWVHSHLWSVSTRLTTLPIPKFGLSKEGLCDVLRGTRPKWRPQTFSDVVGQAHVTTTLKNQILSERVGHAYLFWGPRGTGKTTVARIFAKAVNCPNRLQETEFDFTTTAEPCNRCEFCNDISHSRSLDVFEMDAASNRGIDTIRDLRENVKLSPATCTYKIYIIDEAHMLSPEAFNALLKTLEEPPPHVIFIMATTEHAKIPKDNQFSLPRF